LFTEKARFSARESRPEPGNLARTKTMPNVGNELENCAFFVCCSGLLVSFLYFRTTAKLDVDKITKTTGFCSNALQFIGLLFYRFFR